MASAPIVLMYPLFLVIFGRSARTIIMMGFVAGLPPVILKTIEGLAGTRRVLINVGRSFKLTGPQLFWKILFPAALPTIFVGLRLGLIFALINIVGVEFLINFGGLGQLINDLAERYDLPGTYAAICFVILVSVVLLHRHRTDRAMAETGRLTRRAAPRIWRASGDAAAHRDHRRRSWSSWEALAASGLLFRDVVPSLLAIGARARASCSPTRNIYWHLGVTAGEVGTALADRRRCPASWSALVLGANRLLSQRVRALSLLSRADAEDHLLPGHDHVVRRRPRLEGRDGRALVLLPDRAQSAAAGMRQIDTVLIRVGRSFRANTWQMATKIYLPAMRQPIINGVRLGLGVAIIGTLLAETKLSNRGIGFLIIQAYTPVRHAAHVRAADRAVRARDRRQRAGRPPRRPRIHQDER